MMFYYVHPAVVYVNKFRVAGLLDDGLDQLSEQASAGRAGAIEQAHRRLLGFLCACATTLFSWCMDRAQQPGVLCSCHKPLTLRKTTPWECPDLVEAAQVGCLNVAGHERSRLVCNQHAGTVAGSCSRLTAGLYLLVTACLLCKC